MEHTKNCKSGKISHLLHNKHLEYLEKSKKKLIQQSLIKLKVVLGQRFGSLCRFCVYYEVFNP